jgi:hypothetical protein
MRNDRRIFLAGLLAAATTPLVISGQQMPSQNPAQPNQPGAMPSHTPSEFPSDDGDRNPEPGSAPTPDPRLVLKQNRKDLQHDADELALMSQDLKKQVDTLDTTQILSLDLVHKAEAIEKLAHQIKTLAQGR